MGIDMNRPGNYVVYKHYKEMFKYYTRRFESVIMPTADKLYDMYLYDLTAIINKEDTKENELIVSIDSIITISYKICKQKFGYRDMTNIINTILGVDRILDYLSVYPPSKSYDELTLADFDDYYHQMFG